MKLNVLFQFLFDTEKVEELLVEKWTKIYDPDFIENMIMKKLDEKLEKSWFIELL